MKLFRRPAIYALAMLLALSACSMSADAGLAEAEVPKFHELLNAGKFEQIYDTAASDMHNASPKKDFVALLEAVHRKLGNSSTAERTNVNVNYHTSGTFVTLTYKTRYDEGEAVEQFVYRLKGKTATLAGFHINSTALILR